MNVDETLLGRKLSKKCFDDKPKLKLNKNNKQLSYNFIGVSNGFYGEKFFRLESQSWLKWSRSKIDKLQKCLAAGYQLFLFSPFTSLLDRHRFRFCVIIFGREIWESYTNGDDINLILLNHKQLV
jgi:hypothetical protein